MTAPGGRYYIHDQLNDQHPHHKSFVDLWETRWESLAKNMTYPFLYTDDKDFEPIVKELARLGAKEPYEWQSFASAFDPQACRLFEVASAAEQAGELDKASEYYLRAANVWFVSRYPAKLCEAQQNAWERSKVACLRGLQLAGVSIQEELVPHKYGLSSEGKQIPIWISLPSNASKENPVPIVLGMGGLDSWRPEFSCFARLFQRCGIGMIVTEIPGTGDSPALADDPLSPDRQWSSLLDWIDGHEAIDSQKVVGWGISTGGFYAIRAAYTHSTRFLGMISHGGASHHAFDPEWLENIDQREFAHSASEAFAWKWGFKGNIEKFVKEAKDKFSLLADGTLDKTECARLFLVNGIDDSIFPIDDSYLCLEHGPQKEVRNKGHMGGKMSYGIVLQWILNILEIDVSLHDAMSSLDYKPRY